eukprot:1376032-Amorphochlora_amoeboformis.AAC.1
MKRIHGTSGPSTGKAEANDSSGKQKFKKPEMVQNENCLPRKCAFWALICLVPIAMVVKVGINKHSKTKRIIFRPHTVSRTSHVVPIVNKLDISEEIQQTTGRCPMGDSATGMMHLRDLDKFNRVSAGSLRTWICGFYIIETDIEMNKSASVNASARGKSGASSTKMKTRLKLINTTVVEGQ